MCGTFDGNNISRVGRKSAWGVRRIPGLLHSKIHAIYVFQRLRPIVDTFEPTSPTCLPVPLYVSPPRSPEDQYSRSAIVEKRTEEAMALWMGVLLMVFRAVAVSVAENMQRFPWVSYTMSHLTAAGRSPSPPIKSLDFGGIDSSRLFILRGGNSHVR